MADLDPFEAAYLAYVTAVKQAWADVDIDALSASLVFRPGLQGCQGCQGCGEGFSTYGTAGTIGSVGTWGGTLGTAGTVGSFGSHVARGRLAAMQVGTLATTGSLASLPAAPSSVGAPQCHATAPPPPSLFPGRGAPTRRQGDRPYAGGESEPA